MKSVGVFEAKNRLSELIESGETITITKHGKPVATLTPVRGSAAEAPARIRALRIRNGLSMTEAEIVKLTQSDRR